MSRVKLSNLFTITLSILFVAGCSTATPASIPGMVRPPTGTPIPIETFALTKKPTEAATATAPAIETAYAGTVLNSSEMSELDLVGDANRLNVSYEGIPVNVILAVSPSAVKNFFDGHGLTLDESIRSLGVDPEANLAEFILMGHYRGYMKDHSLNSNNYSFDKYIQDMKAGKDLSYSVWGIDKTTNKAGSIKVDPKNEVQLVYAGFTADQNGDSTISISPTFRIGYYLTQNGDLRVTMFYSKDDQSTLDYLINYNFGLAQATWDLGVSEEEQKTDNSLSMMQGKDPLLLKMWTLVNPIIGKLRTPIFKER